MIQLMKNRNGSNKQVMQFRVQSLQYKIYKQMISSKTIIIASVLLCACIAQLCDSPQKSFYMSYNAMSNHDYLANLFQNISSLLPTYNTVYTDKDNTVYSVLNFKPHLYYNQHRQTESYFDQLFVNVTLGQLYMTYHFDFTIKYQDKNVSGWARGRTLVDQYSFLKRLAMIDGALEWDPYNLAPLDINSQFSIEYSQPKLSMNQTTIYVQLLNDYLGNYQIKKNLITKTNEVFADRLKYHLNHQPLIGNNSIEYKYGNISLSYVNVIREFKVNNADTKGLEVFLLFGFEDGKQPCIEIPKQFDEESYGGVQEIISMGSVKATVQKAASMGLFNQVLDKKYQVPFFQFYMGDMGNFVEYANKLPAHDPFTISCTFANDRADELKIMKLDEHDLYVQVPQDCSISYKQAIVMKVSFDMNLVIRLSAEQDYLNAQIYNVGIYGDKYFSIDPKFVVTDPYVARYTLTAVVKGLVGRTVFGTGWKTFARKYPVIRILDDYIVIFDASEK